MTRPPTASMPAQRSLRAPVLWGVVFGFIQAAAPLGLWWLDPATVYALSLTLIAAVYIGFAVADGRPTVIAVESAIAAAGGRRSAWSSTGSSQRSWPCSSPSGSISTSRTKTTDRS